MSPLLTREILDVMRLKAVATLEGIETNQFAALYRTDHYGVGRGGVQEEGA